MFHTHLVQQALALLPPLCPIAKGKCYMFVFILEVLGNDGPGSFFSIRKKAAQSCRSQHKPIPPGLPSSSQPPLPPSDPKIWKAAMVLKWNLAALQPPASAFPPPLLSPLSALPPFLGAGSSHVSPKFVESWTLTPGLPPEPLAPLNPLPSPVTLSQVEVVLATSEMVWDLVSCHHSSPLLTSFNSPLSLTPSFIHASGSSVLIGHESALFHISLCRLVTYACSLVRPRVCHAPYCLLYHGASPLVLLRDV
jgi:hypothetical protein